jgi:hypothetical protein
VTSKREPIVGWRLWRVRGSRLESWAASFTWEPDDNVARCLAPVRRCPTSPGRGCRCGFWGLFSPLRCIDRARAERTERSSVLGLIRAWGEVAVHGSEGFRAEHARVVCLFTDWVWESPTLPCPEKGVARWWWRAMEALHYVPRPVPPDPWRRQALQEAAPAYGVPLLSLKDAVRYGVLDEMGADEEMRREAQSWVDLVGPGRMWRSD